MEMPTGRWDFDRYLNVSFADTGHETGLFDANIKAGRKILYDPNIESYVVFHSRTSWLLLVIESNLRRTCIHTVRNGI